jgi:hypothetical protein
MWFCFKNQAAVNSQKSSFPRNTQKTRKHSVLVKLNLMSKTSDIFKFNLMPVPQYVVTGKEIARDLFRVFRVFRGQISFQNISQFCDSSY